MTNRVISISKASELLFGAAPATVSTTPAYDESIKATWPVCKTCNKSRHKPNYDQCYTCSMEDREDWPVCSTCNERQHNPKFSQCYACSMEARQYWVTCASCGEKTHDPKFSQCFSCSMEARQDWITCIECGKKMHDPKFRTCFDCSGNARSEDHEAETPSPWILPELEAKAKQQHLDASLGDNFSIYDDLPF